MHILLFVACSESPLPTDGATAQTCPEGELLDAGTCVPEACGEGTWGNLGVDEATVYVDASASDAGSGGDGSVSAPLHAIQAGLDLAAERGGSHVAVAAGTYVENVTMGDAHEDLVLTGRCEDLVSIDGSEGDGTATITIAGNRKSPNIGIQGLTVTGAPYIGVWIEHAVVTMAGVQVAGNRAVGLLALDGATVTLENVGVVSNLAAEDGTYGFGIDVQGASLTATGCTVAGNAGVGVYANGASSTVDLVSTLVSETHRLADGTHGYGIEANLGAALTATDCTVDGNAGSGVLADGTGTFLGLQDTVVRETQLGVFGAGGDAGDGIHVQNGAWLTASACTIEQNADIGVTVQDAGTVADLESTAVLDTLPLADGTGGHGVEVYGGASLTATGCTIQGNSELGVGVSGGGTLATLEDTLVLDTLPDRDGSGGFGVQVTDGASLTATACTIQGSSGVGLDLSDPGSSVVLSNSEVKDTALDANGHGGMGIDVSLGGELNASGCRFEGNCLVGVLASGAGTVVTLADTSVVNTSRGRNAAVAAGAAAQDSATLTAKGLVISGTQGPGLYVSEGGTLACTSCTLSGNTFAGALALNGSLTLYEADITDNAPDPEFGGGFGLFATSAHGPIAASVTDSTIGPHAYAAAWLDGDGLYTFEGNQLYGSGGIDQNGNTIHGNAIFAENGTTAFADGTGLLLLDNTLIGATDIAVFLDGSSATLAGNTWVGNGTDLLQQHCDGIPPLASEELVGAIAKICPNGNTLTAYDLDFSTLYLPTAETEE